MYTMLVVDDNPADRRGICSLFDWRAMGIEILETCSNGQRAMEILGKQGADIVVTDVAMPVMNGISLAEHLLRSHPRTRVVFMSCHSDFEYAKSAINMDIHGYVLKPIIPEELLAVITKILKELTEEAGTAAERERMARQLTDMRPMVQEQFLKELLLGNCRDKDDIERRMEFLQLASRPRGCLYVLSLAIEEFEKQTQNMTVEDKYFVSYTMKNIISAQDTPALTVHPVQFSGNDYAAVVFRDPPTAGTGNAAIVDLAVTLHNAVHASLRLSLTVGISRESGDIAGVPELYRQSREAAGTQFYGGSNPIISYDSIESEPFSPMSLVANPGSLYRDIKELVAMGNQAADVELVDRYLRVGSSSLPESYVKSVTFSIANMVAVVLNEYGYSFSDVFGLDTVIWERLEGMKSIDSVRAWLLDVLGTFRERFTDRSRSRGARLVERVRQIIKERYREQISVDDIAEAVELSQSYANSIVKRETGKSIFDHLMEYRLEVAKKLLMNPESRIGGVSESVGYENKSYFALMFRKQVGVSPSEFRARFTP